MQKIQGFVEQGNTTLIISGAAGTIAQKVQGSYPSATLTVFLAGTVTLATIYGDNASTPKANPFTSSADGTWFFYVPNGSYDVRFSGGGIATPFTLGALSAFDENQIWIDVKSAPYLAQGNGTTDDTASIQAALNAVVPGIGGTVYFPPGTYKCTAPLTMTGRIVQMIGAGREISIISFPNSGMEGIVDTSGSRYAHFTLRGAGPSAPGGPSGNGFNTGNLSDVVFDDLVVENWPLHGLNTGGSSIRMSICNCIIRGNGGDGILIGGGSTDCLIQGCQSYSNGSWGLDFNASKNIAINNHIHNNGGIYGPFDGDGGGITVFGTVISGIPYSADNNIFIGNQIEQNVGSGMVIAAVATSSANDTIVSGNKISNQTVGILVGGGGNGPNRRTKIIGNTISNHSATGVLLQIIGATTVAETEIISNTVDSNGSSGIGVQVGATDTIIFHNTVLGNVPDQIHDDTHLAILAGNRTQSGDESYNIVAANLVTGFSSALGTGLQVKSALNTELRLTSSQIGSREYSHVIDQFGNWDLYDISAVAIRLQVDSGGIVRVPVGLAIGGGSSIQLMVGIEATLDFPSTAAQTASDLTLALTGARPGYPTQVSPSSGVWANSGNGFYVACCTANDVVTVRFVNPTAGPIDPISGSFIVLQTRF